MPPTVSLTPELLSTLAGILLSLLMSYTPGLRDWWAAFTAEQKSLGMLVLLVLVSVAIFGFSCGAFGLSWNGLVLTVPCDQSGATRLVWTFLLALMANQSAYKISPQLKSAAVQAPTPVETKESPFVQEPPAINVPPEVNQQSHA